MPRKLPPLPSRESLKFHRSLSIENLLKIIQGEVNKIPEHRVEPLVYSKLDVVMSGFAVFSLKYPSLLQFDKNKDKRRIKYNLRTLFGVQKAPCDTTLREVCDVVTRMRYARLLQKSLRPRIAKAYLTTTVFLADIC
jgi:hypothetical protein